jgi:hypothetical protein
MKLIQLGAATFGAAARASAPVLSFPAASDPQRAAQNWRRFMMA